MAENKVGVITDSIACLTREAVAQYGIEIIPLNFYFRGKVYRDWVDINPSEAYELFLQDPESFYTSPASAMDYLEVYREVSAQTRDILCITLSSKLSTGYDMACLAKEQVREEFPHLSIEVMDSLAVTAAEGFVALAAARTAADGVSLSAVITAAEKIRDRVNFLVLLDTVRYVYRSGRVPKIAAQAGSMLNIRPILTTSSGVLRFKGAVRSREHGIERMLDMVRDKVGQKPIHMAVMHAYAPDQAEGLMKRISSEFNCAELWLTEFSPVMGYVCGTGTVGFAFYQD